MSEVAALDARVTRMEAQIDAGFKRIEDLLRQEINDLKKEQIEDLKKENTRLADDQRRLWDHVSSLELRENARIGEHKGTHRVISAVWALLVAAGGGAVGWLATWLTSGNTPPHH